MYKIETPMLREKVSRKDKQFRKRLNNIDELVRRIVEKQGIQISAARDADPPTDCCQDAPLTSLTEIPTQVLFHELKNRDKNFAEASMSSSPSKGANLAFNQPGSGGAVSYSAIRNVCNDLGN